VRGHRDLEAAVVAAAVCAIAALLLPNDVVRLVFALPLVLLLPGYAIASASLAKREIEYPQLALISVALSLAVLALGGLALNYLGGLHPGTWALLLFLVVLAAARGAALRRRAAAPAASLRPQLQRRPAVAAVGLILGGIVAAAAALVLTFTPVSAKHAVGYSDLWMRPYDHGSADVRIGVGNQEHDRTAYGLIANFGHGRHLAVRRFALDPGQRHVVRLSVPPPRGRSEPVAVTLYRRAQPNVPYRRVSGWISATGGSG
jgi:uncharacterized membrane protein